MDGIFWKMRALFSPHPLVLPGLPHLLDAAWSSAGGEGAALPSGCWGIFAEAQVLTAWGLPTLTLSVCPEVSAPRREKQPASAAFRQ